MGDALTIVMTAIGLGLSLVLGRISVNQFHQVKSAAEFLLVRRTLRESSGELRRFAAWEHRSQLGAGTGVAAITKPGWILERPLEVDRIVLNLVAAPPDPPVDPRRVLMRYWPLSNTGRRYSRYHEAVSELDRPANWFDAACYRMVAVRPSATGSSLSLDLAATRYWLGFDTTEALAHEAAHVYQRTKGAKISGPFRRKLGDPFDFERRHCPVGFVTLTVRQDGDDSTFFLMRRGSKVATGVNMTAAVPSGEFQPSDDSPFSLRRDLDLWFAVMREYAEEFLGHDEVREHRGAPIDYDHEPPFDLMQAARRQGLMRLYFLGLGVEPLTWKAQLYTVCVFEGATFDRLFADMIQENAEGVLQLPSLHRGLAQPFQGWRFDEPTVRQYLDSLALSPSSRVALRLTWRHRFILGLTGDGPSGAGISGIE
ncbi:hypothetical protein ACFWGI_07855 [Streptomyces niveus]|uniref:hypothetical protein n=1 Tax=Streptomyces niveus TaxID=193462 RepID=UPI003646ACD2